MRQASVNPYQNPRNHHLPHSQPLHHPPVATFAPHFVPPNTHINVHQRQYFQQQALARSGPSPALQSSYASPVQSSFINTPAPLHYQQQHQFSIPVHNGIPLQQQLPRAHEIHVQHVPPPDPPIVESSLRTAIQLPKQDKHLKGLKCILEPEHKDSWRQRLFEVDGMMILTEEQYDLKT